MMKKLFTINFILIIFLLFLISVCYSQIMKKENNTVDNYSSISNTQKTKSSSYKIILSPSVSVWNPDNSDVYGMSLKYGLEAIYKFSDKFMIEFGYSFSSLGIQSEYIKNIVSTTFEDEINDFKLTKSNGGDVNQFFGGIRYLFQSSDKYISYFNAGVSTYKRGNINASYSFRSSYKFIRGNYIEYAEKRGTNIYFGHGFVILFYKGFGLDFQQNGYLIFLEDDKQLWFGVSLSSIILL